MTKSLRELARDEREQLEEPEAWIAWVRLAAVPFAVLEVAIERGNYPRDHETWAWTLTAIFAAGAAALFVAARRRGVRDTASGSRRAPLAGAAALVFDTTVVSGYTVLYAI